MDNLTKDSKRLLALIYREYLLDINNGISKSDAKQIGSAEMIHEKLVPNELLEDLVETLRELDNADFLFNLYGDDSIDESVITNKMIIYMENKNLNTIKNIGNFLLKLK